jgi:hypothetical protein
VKLLFITTRLHRFSREALKQGWSFYPKDILEIKKKIEEAGKPLKELDVKINY